MSQKKVQELLKKVAQKHELPMHVIEEVYLSQYRKLKEELRSLEFKTIKLPNWGKYIPSQRKLNKINYDRKREDRDKRLNKDNGNSK